MNIFSELLQSKGQYVLRRENKKLCYSTSRDILLNKLDSLGFDKKIYGLHSLRSGGASAAANAGITDRMFKRHGRWKSETAKDGYVKDSLESRLRVSLSLGL